MATRYCLRLCFNLLHYWGRNLLRFHWQQKLGSTLLFDFQPSKLQTSNLQTFSQSVYIESSSPSFALKTRRALKREPTESAPGLQGHLSSAALDFRLYSANYRRFLKKHTILELQKNTNIYNKTGAPRTPVLSSRFQALLM